MKLPRRWVPRVAGVALLLPVLLLPVLMAGLASCEPVVVDAPSPPALDRVSSPTGASIVRVFGDKQPGTGVLVDDEEGVALDEAGGFVVDVTLTEGENTIEFVAFDGAGRRSTAVELVVELDLTPPAAPTVDDYESSTVSPSISLSGTKEEGSVVRIGGTQLDAPAETTTWTHDVALLPGENIVRITAADEVGNESTPIDLLIVRGVVTFTVDSSAAFTTADMITFTGTRGSGVQVRIDDAEVVAASASGAAWTATRPLVEGINTFTLTGALGPVEVDVVRTVTRDTMPPAPPTVDTIAPTGVGCQVSVSGTKEANSGVRIFGMQRVGVDALTTWGPVMAPVTPGDGTLDVTSVDAAGNESSPTTPAPATYCDPNGVYFAVDPWPTTVLTSPLTLTGVRGAQVAIEVDGTLVLAANGATSWSYDLPLTADTNNSVVVAGVASGLRNEVTVDVFFAATPPAAPTVMGPALVTSSPATLTGTRPAGTAVLVGAVNPVLLTPTGTGDWSFDAPLLEGVNTFTFRARDAAGRVSAPAQHVVTLDAQGPMGTIASPVTGAFVGRSVVVSGTAFDDDGITAVRVCVGACAVPGDFVAATGTTSWTATVDTLSVGNGTSGAMNTVAVEVDTPLQTGVRVATSTVYLVHEPLLGPATSGESFVDVVAFGTRGLAAVWDDGGLLTLLVDTGPSFAPATQQIASAGASLPRIARTGTTNHMVFLDESIGLAGEPGVSARNFDGSLDGPFTVVAGAAGRGVSSADVAAGASLVSAFVRADGAGNADVERSTFSAVWGGPFLVTDATSDQPRDVRTAITGDGLQHFVWVDRGDYDGDGVADDDVMYARADPAAASAPSERFVVSGEGAYGGVQTDGGVVLDGGAVLDGGFDSSLADGVSRAPAIAVDPSTTDRVWITWIDSGDVDGVGAGVDSVMAVSVTAGVLDTASLIVVTQGVAGTVGDDVVVDVDAAGDPAFVWTASAGGLGSGADADVFARRLRASLENPAFLVSRSAIESRHPGFALDAAGAGLFLWQDDDGAGGDLLYFVRSAP